MGGVVGFVVCGVVGSVPPVGAEAPVDVFITLS